MSFAETFEGFMPDTVTIEPLASTTGGGSRSYGAAKTVRARIQQLARLVRDRNGREVVSNTKVFLAPRATDGSAISPGADDRITLPAGYTPQQPPVISVERANDDQGLHHWVINL